MGFQTWPTQSVNRLILYWYNLLWYFLSSRMVISEILPCLCHIETVPVRHLFFVSFVSLTLSLSLSRCQLSWRFRSWNYSRYSVISQTHSVRVNKLYRLYQSTGTYVQPCRDFELFYFELFMLKFEFMLCRSSQIYVSTWKIVHPCGQFTERKPHSPVTSNGVWCFRLVNRLCSLTCEMEK